MKGQFKDEFVTAGGVPLAEVGTSLDVPFKLLGLPCIVKFNSFPLVQISLNTMESRIRPNLFFAGEVVFRISCSSLAYW